MDQKGGCTPEGLGAGVRSKVDDRLLDGEHENNLDGSRGVSDESSADPRPIAEDHVGSPLLAFLALRNKNSQYGSFKLPGRLHRDVKPGNLVA